ncbi:peptide/nickel transport system ATP-binding protein [Loktanella fryxellensis]|uniref:Peptide/nickel transport system ATP-binding protein n=1 Tax=Loktanella fryxellensis TaxID=245187 RepID=A0A1H8IEW6_9RHOB|nr:ABC transporter ATP-binding protein [Loktanella fryxellensis]SEN66686.1 peptide/nickel transport system ATP-binding protein [Loktanella fryxellensis]
MTPLLAIQGLSVTFATRDRLLPAVTDLTLTIAAGEALALVGESGCGKSTVAAAILRDLGPSGRITGGTVRLDGQDLSTLSPAALRAIRGRRIVMVQQDPMASLNPAMTVGAQLAEVPMIHEGVSRAAAMVRARAIVADVQLPDPDRILRSYPHQLSGGQQQRIVIAMALMSRPSLLILDEPTTALDVTVEAAVVQLVKDLCRSQGTALLFITHNLGLVLDVCDRICVMYAGEVVEAGPARAVFDAMRHPYTQALFRAIPVPAASRDHRPLVTIPGTMPQPDALPPGCRFAPRCAHAVAGLCDAGPVPLLPVRPGATTLDTRRAALPHMTRCLRHTAIEWDAAPTAFDPQPRTAPGPVVLRVAGLHTHYPVARSLFARGRAQVVRANTDVTFDLHAGETLAVVGESGSGKSTLARVLTGLVTATAGQVRFHDRPIGGVPVADRDPATVAAIQMVFQNPADTLNPSVSVGRQIQRALTVFRIGRNTADRQERMLGLLDRVRLPRSAADRLPRHLSGGQRQRVGIARAFAGTPQVVVADEPVSALDVSVQAAITDLLIDMQARHGTALLFISHDLGIVRYLADRVLVMYLGYVVEAGSTAQVFAPPYHPYTEALLSAVPIADTGVKRRQVILQGDVPSAVNPPPGCPFQTRCHRKDQVPGDLCDRMLPDLRTLPGGGQIRCHLPDAVLAAMTPVIAGTDAAG